MKKFIKVIVLAMAFVLVFATLASCGKSLDKIEKKAKDAGFEVEVEKVEEVDEDGVVAYMEISDPNSTGLIPAEAEVVEFEDADAAKEYYEEAKKALEALEALGLDGTYDVKRSGKVVISGHVDIIKKVW